MKVSAETKNRLIISNIKNTKKALVCRKHVQ